MDLRIGFFASHDGSNVVTVFDNIKEGKLDAQACVIISNNSDAGVFDIARDNGVAYYCLNDKNYPQEKGSLDDSILDVLSSYNVNLIVLAGYAKKISGKIIGVYKNRILNIHPSLLPKHGGRGMYGLNVHQSVLESGDKKSGSTIHLVTGEYDVGRILAQEEVDVGEDDADALSKKISFLGGEMLVRALDEIQSGLIDLNAR